MSLSLGNIKEEERGEYGFPFDQNADSCLKNTFGSFISIAFHFLFQSVMPMGLRK